LAWLTHRHVRYLQFDITSHATSSDAPASPEGLRNLDWLTPARYHDEWEQSMRPIRDADITMPYVEFERFVAEAAFPTGDPRFEASRTTDELHRVLEDARW
jgi:hypothetical protein